MIALAFALLSFLPLIYSPFFLNPYLFPKAIFYFAIVFALIPLISLAFFSKTGLILPPKKILIILALFFVTQLLSSILSIQPFSSFFGLWGDFTGGLIHTFSLLLIFLVAFHAAATSHRFPLLVSWVSALTLALVCLKGVYEYLIIYRGERVTSTVGEANRLGLYLIMVLPLIFGLLKQTTSTWKKGLLSVTALLALLVIGLTFSRGSWLILVTSFGLFSLFAPKHLQQLLPERRLLWTINIVLAGALLLLFPLYGDKRRLSSTLINLVQQKGSVSIRLQEWQATLKTISNRSSWYQHLLGSGPETVTYTFLKFRPANFNRLPQEKFWRLTQVRNLYLSLWSNVGAAGVALFLIFVALVFNNLQISTSPNPIFSGWLVAWVIILISGFYSSLDIISAPFFWFASAFLLAQCIPKKISLRFSSATLYPILGLSFLLYSGILFFLIQAILAEVFAREQKFSLSARFNPLNDFYFREEARQKLDAWNQDHNPKLLKAALVSAQHAYNLNSLEPKNLLILEKTLDSAQDKHVFLIPQPDLKLKQVRLEWVKIDPSNPVAHDKLGLSLIEQANFSEAKSEFVKAVSLDPSYIPALTHYEMMKSLE